MWWWITHRELGLETVFESVNQWCIEWLSSSDHASFREYSSSISLQDDTRTDFLRKITILMSFLPCLLHTSTRLSSYIFTHTPLPLPLKPPVSYSLPSPEAPLSPDPTSVWVSQVLGLSEFSQRSLGRNLIQTESTHGIVTCCNHMSRFQEETVWREGISHCSSPPPHPWLFFQCVSDFVFVSVSVWVLGVEVESLNKKRGGSCWSNGIYSGDCIVSELVPQ